MKNKITVKGLNTQYSEIIVEKECSYCKGEGITNKRGLSCIKCKRTGKITTKHFVNNNGEFNLTEWIKYFENKEE